MAWINDKTRIYLARYAAQFGDRNKRKIEESFFKLTGLKNLKFLSYSNEIIYAIINGYELHLVKSIDNFFSLSQHDKERKLSHINSQILKHSRVVYKNEQFLREGSFGFCRLIDNSLEDYDGLHAKYIVEKESKESNLDRFIMEKEILIELIDAVGIVQIDNSIDFPNKYRMEFIEHDLDDCIKDNLIPNENKNNLIIQLIEIGVLLKNRNILHRDLHPGNFLINIELNEIKVCDFGLGIKYKDLNKNEKERPKYNYKYIGRKGFVHRRQFRNLNNADFDTECFSFSRIINFILTGKATSKEHPLKKYCVKADVLDYSSIMDMYNEMIVDGFLNTTEKVFNFNQD